MARKQKNITIASFNYLQEISAIPPGTRQGYLQKLSARKNAGSQKNVKLLLSMYDYVDKNMISEWDPKYICKNLGMTSNALYLHKSRLLDGLRKYYFNSERIKSEINSKYNGQSSNKRNQKGNDTENKIETARKMASLGMMREARKMYLGIQKRLQTSEKLSPENCLISAEIDEFMAYSYFNQRNKKLLSVYSGRLAGLNGLINRKEVRLKPVEKTKFDILYKYAEFYLYLLDWYRSGQIKLKKNYHEKLYSLSKKIDNKYFLLKTLHVCVVLEMSLGNFNKAKDYCIEGYNIARESDKRTEYFVFASFLRFISTRIRSKKAGLSRDDILNYYWQIKSQAPLNIWTLYLENSIVLTYYPEKKPDVLEVLREQINSNILLGDYSFAVYWRFILDMENYYDRLLTFLDSERANTKGYLEMKKVDPGLLRDINSTCANTKCYHKEFNDLSTTWDLYKLQLISYYFDEENINIDEVTSLISRMERMAKREGELKGMKTFELLKLSLDMLEYKEDKAMLLNKYEQKFRNYVNGLMSEPLDFFIIEYAIIAGLARRLKRKEIDVIVTEFYNWIETRHPEIFEPFIRQIRDKESKMYTVSGTDAA